MLEDTKNGEVQTVPLAAYEAFVERSYSVLRTALIGFGAAFLVMAGTIAYLIVG